MQRRYSEPNTYIDAIPSISQDSNELYDDVASLADPEVNMGIKNPRGICVIFCFILISGCFPTLTSSSRIIQDAGENSEPNCEGSRVQEDNEMQSKTTQRFTDAEQDNNSKIYLDLVPLPSFLHPTSGSKASPSKEPSRESPVHAEEQDPLSQNKEVDH